MLTLNRIRLTQYKNYPLREFEFNHNVVAITGLNGKGKTNLLDAIHYCCLAKSYFSPSYQLSTMFGTDGFRIEGYFNSDEKALNVVCVTRGNKKELSLNAIPYEKFSQHIGILPIVMIAPDDIELITGAAELRRNFVDTLLCQLKPGYIQELIKYNKLLQQRNSQLRLMASESAVSSEVLDILDEQIAPVGLALYKSRKELLDKLLPLAATFYRRISGTDENVFLVYQSQLENEDFHSLLFKGREKDLITQRSNWGIHRDDLIFQLESKLFRLVASQGQRKSLLFALKLAEFEIIKERKGFSPMLLMDDVFEKLDGHRMNHLLQWVCTDNEGQVFITDTHRERLEEAFDSVDITYQMIELE